jgi:hypothetical protein
LRTIAILFALLACSPSWAAVKDLKADFGAVGDFVADDTGAVQAAFDWVIADKGELFIPPGVYRITAQLTFRQGNNTYVHGHTRPGAGWSTSLKWDGPPGGTMLLLDGSRETEWSDFAIDAGINAAIEPDILIDIDKVTPGSWNSRENAFRRMLFRGGKVATVRISHVTHLNNEANIFEDVGNWAVPGSAWSPVTDGGGIGYLIQDVNAKGQQIIRGDISGKSIAVYAEEGSAHMTGTQIGGCGTWFKHGGYGESSSMTACDGDSSRTFLEMGPSQTGPFVATANRFYPHHDGPLLILGDTVGPVILQGNEFASGNYRTPAQSYVQVTGNGPNLVAIGNTFTNGSMLPVPGTLPPKLRALYALGNVHYSPGNQVTLSSDYLIPFRQTGTSLTSLQIGGASGFRGDLQPIALFDRTIQTSQGVVSVQPTASWTLTSKPSLQPGLFEGQEVRILNVGGFDLGLMDEKTLPGSGLILLDRTILLKPKASATFQWTAAYGGRWIQVSPVVSPL